MLLTGEVPSAEVRQRIEDEVRRIDTVTHVTKRPGRDAQGAAQLRLKDALISTKVKAAPIENRDAVRGVRRSTPNAAPCTCWAVSPTWKAASPSNWPATTGVEQVVKMFEVITLRKPTPGPEPTRLMPLAEV